MPNVPDEPHFTLNEALKDRFLSDLARTIGANQSRTLGLAISGGPDSVALMLLAAGSGLPCVAATVDHGLRPEAADEARFVAALCATYAIPHTTLRVEPPTSRSNLMEWARGARYAALETWRVNAGADVILTAHHADDQLETMIMRLNRGSGVAGLSGIRRKQGVIARPLLSWTKVELEALVAAAGIQAIDDPSNRNDQFDRARLRKALQGADWLDPQAAVRSAAALAEAEEALDWAAKAWFNRRTAEKNAILSLDPRDLPSELLRRITLACLRRYTPDAAPRGEELDRLMIGLFDGKTATLAGVRCTGGPFWLFALAPPRRKN
jgi:tRNA(Ile)-lysidine synthase